MNMLDAPTSRQVGQHALRAGALARTILLYGLLGLVALLVLLPLLFALSLALQGPTLSPTLVPDFGTLDWSSFRKVFSEEPNLTRWIVNSFVVSLAVTLGQLITSALAAYALTHMRFPGKIAFFFFFLGTLMIPWESTIIPNYLTITRLGWKDSYQGLIAPFLASGFGIFLLRQYFLTIPHDLYEAAVLDGCGYARYLWSVLILIDTKRILPVQNFIDKEKLSLVDDLEPAVARYYTIGGKLYSLPFNSSAPVMYYDRNAFKEVGLDPDKKIWTYDELLDAAKKLTKSVLPHTAKTTKA